MSDSCSTPPCEGTGILAFRPPLDAPVVMMALAGTTMLAVIALGVHSRRVVLPFLLFGAMAFQIISCGGLVALNADPENHAGAMLFLLGSLLGPGFAAFALHVVLVHVAEVKVGDAWKVFGRATIVHVAGFLGFLELYAMAMQIFGTVPALTYHENQLIMVGLGVQSALMLLSTLLTAWIAFGALRPPSSASKELHPASTHRVTQVRTWVVSVNVASLLLVTHFLYRVCEQAQGIGGPLSRNNDARTIMISLLPIFAVVLSTVSPPARAIWPPYTGCSSDFEPDSRRASSIAVAVDIELSPRGNNTGGAGSGDVGEGADPEGAAGSTSPLVSPALATPSRPWDDRGLQKVVVELEPVTRKKRFLGRKHRQTEGNQEQGVKRKKAPGQLVADQDALW